MTRLFLHMKYIKSKRIVLVYIFQVPEMKVKSPVEIIFNNIQLPMYGTFNIYPFTSYICLYFQAFYGR